MDFIRNENSFRKKLIWIWGALLLGLQILFTVLSVWYAYIGGDILYAVLDSTLSVVIPVISFLLIYIRFAVLVSVYHSYGEGTLPFTLVATGSLILSHIFGLVIKNFVYADLASVFAEELLGAALSFMIDLAVVILIFLFSKTRREKQRRVTFLAIITCIFPLIISISEESVIIVDFWMRDLGGQVVFTPSMAKALLIPAAEAVLGFAVIFITHRLLLKASAKENK